jgi:hypothetical protein
MPTIGVIKIRALRKDQFCYFLLIIGCIRIPIPRDKMEAVVTFTAVVGVTTHVVSLCAMV